MTPADLAQAQLDAYNAHDLERFVACYHPDVEVYDFPAGTERLRGHEALRTTYGPLFENEALKAEVVHRIVHGAVVIDHEHVTGLRDDAVAAVAMYETEQDTIRRVWFVRSR